MSNSKKYFINALDYINDSDESEVLPSSQDKSDTKTANPAMDFSKISKKLLPEMLVQSIIDNDYEKAAALVKYGAASRVVVNMSSGAKINLINFIARNMNGKLYEALPPETMAKYAKPPSKNQLYSFIDDCFNGHHTSIKWFLEFLKNAADKPNNEIDRAYLYSVLRNADFKSRTLFDVKSKDTVEDKINKSKMIMDFADAALSMFSKKAQLKTNAYSVESASKQALNIKSNSVAFIYESCDKELALKICNDEDIALAVITSAGLMNYETRLSHLILSKKLLNNENLPFNEKLKDRWKKLFSDLQERNGYEINMSVKIFDTVNEKFPHLKDLLTVSSNQRYNNSVYVKLNNQKQNSSIFTYMLTRYHEVPALKSFLKTSSAPQILFDSFKNDPLLLIKFIHMSEIQTLKELFLGNKDLFTKWRDPAGLDIASYIIAFSNYNRSNNSGRVTKSAIDFMLSINPDCFTDAADRGASLLDFIDATNKDSSEALSYATKKLIKKDLNLPRSMTARVKSKKTPRLM